MSGRCPIIAQLQGSQDHRASQAERIYLEDRFAQECEASGRGVLRVRLMGERFTGAMLHVLAVHPPAALSIGV